jgi:hypothetical protein
MPPLHERQECKGNWWIYSLQGKKLFFTKQPSTHEVNKPMCKLKGFLWQLIITCISIYARWRRSVTLHAAPRGRGIGGGVYGLTPSIEDGKFEHFKVAFGYRSENIVLSIVVRSKGVREVNEALRLGHFAGYNGDLEVGGIHIKARKGYGICDGYRWTTVDLRNAANGVGARR